MLDSCTVVLDAHGSRSGWKDIDIGSYRVYFLCEGKILNDVVPTSDGNIVYGSTHDRLINKLYNKEFIKIGTIENLEREIGVTITEDTEVKEHYLYELREQADEPKKYGALQGVLHFSLGRLESGTIQEVVQYSTTISMRCDSLLNQVKNGIVECFLNDTVITMKPSVTNASSNKACIPLSIVIHDILPKMKWSFSYHNISKAYYDADDNNLDYGALSFFLDQNNRLSCRMKGHTPILLTNSNCINDACTDEIDNPVLLTIISNLQLKKADNRFGKEKIKLHDDTLQSLIQHTTILEYVLGLNKVAFVLDSSLKSACKCTCGISYELSMPDHVNIIWDACRTLEKRDILFDRCNWQMLPSHCARYMHFIEKGLHIDAIYTLQAIKYLSETAPNYWSKNIFGNISELWEKIGNLLFSDNLACFVLQHEKYFLLGTIVDARVFLLKYENVSFEVLNDVRSCIIKKGVDVEIKEVRKYSDVMHFGVIATELMLNILSIKSKQDFLLLIDNTSLTSILSADLVLASKKTGFAIDAFTKIRKKHMNALEQYDMMLLTQGNVDDDSADYNDTTADIIELGHSAEYKYEIA